MIFYEIEMLSIPEIIFACSVDSKSYSNRFNCIDGFLELAVCEYGEILLAHKDGREEIAKPGMLVPMVCTDAVVTSSYNTDAQRHSTVGVRMQYNIVRHDTEENCDLAALRMRMSMPKKKILLVPFLEYLDKSYDKTLGLLKKISSLHLSANPTDRLGAISQWYALASLLTNFVLEKIEGLKSDLSPSAFIYAARAQKHIQKWYMQPLTVKEIAAEVGVSEGYLHRIFKAAYNIGITEYINRHRIFVAISLMENKNLSLNEAAANVGIEDPAYMSRLFKKVTGMSYRSYFANKRLKV